VFTVTPVPRQVELVVGVDNFADSGVQLLGGDVALVDERNLACRDARDGLGCLEGAEPRAVGEDSQNVPLGFFGDFALVTAQRAEETTPP
jgi:hypothetical protein